jgi:uncharacterized protein Usg
MLLYIYEIWYYWVSKINICVYIVYGVVMNTDFSDVALKLTGKYRSVSVSVLYFLPEYTNILQEFYWQTDDIIPELYRVHKFLNHWHYNIDANIHEVKIACSSPFSTTSFTNVKYEFPISFNVVPFKLD